ncbi:MAG: prenyltransferase/squalene oxidase repeat-containing protein [Chloroflexota bacterium]|nr:prenyltransferase/squalene oxidase repeat-containing protein [Chloroflexota bacterium]
MIDTLLSQLGTSVMRSVPYDTAWLARLSLTQPQYAPAFDWLREHQLADGSWGSRALYFHDRFICTLSAVLALHDNGIAADQVRVAYGVEFLWRAYPNLNTDPHDTIAYAVLVASMLQEARQRGLHVPQHLAHNPEEVAAKLNLLAGQSHKWRRLTMSFSLEVWRNQIGDQFDFLEDNHSIGVSPAATAAILTVRNDPRPHQYLSTVIARQGDGGLPNVFPIDVFEVGWGLNYLRLSESIEPTDPRIQPHLDFLERNFLPHQGISYSSYFSVKDLDVTSVVMTVLHWAGRRIDPAVFAQYELPDGFRCYPHESSPSLSAQLHLLMCLRQLGYRKDHPWVAKALGQIHRWKEQGAIWFDKWHASPYYLTLPMTEALIEFDESLVAERVRWVMATQQPDGGWGHYGFSTAEETAYTLLALLRWSQHFGEVSESMLGRAAHFLRGAAAEVHTPLWLGKCLYVPQLVVDAGITAALHLYDNRQQPYFYRSSPIQVIREINPFEQTA